MLNAPMLRQGRANCTIRMYLLHMHNKSHGTHSNLCQILLIYWLQAQWHHRFPLHHQGEFPYHHSSEEVWFYSSVDYASSSSFASSWPLTFKPIWLVSTFTGKESYFVVSTVREMERRFPLSVTLAFSWTASPDFPEHYITIKEMSSMYIIMWYTCTCTCT